MPHELTQEHRRVVYEELRDGFDEDEAKRLVELRLDAGAWAEIPGRAWADRAFELLRWAEKNAIVDLLVFAMRDARPRSGALARLAAARGVGTSMRLLDNGPAELDGIERVIESRLSFVLSHDWYRSYGEAMRRVCRVRVGNDVGGTGFLVGDDVILTAWHVVANASLTTLRVLFDHFNPVGGRTVQLHADALVCHAAFNADETAGRTEAARPVTAELDFALLRLADPVGAQPVDAELAPRPARGALSLPRARPRMKARDPILVLQHPRGEPQTLAIDTSAWKSWAHDGLRAQYTANTRRGTSGAPVFGFHWNVLALHHYGSGRYGFNQGIPAHLIRQHIVDAGHGDLLAAE